MKLGKIFLAAIFFLIFIASAFVAVDSMRSVTYEDVFPDDINAIIWIHQPLDVPLKVLNSRLVRKFFETETGKDLQKQLDQALAGIGAGPEKKKDAPPLVIFKKKIEGITVFYIEIVKKEDEEDEEKTEEETEEETPAETHGKEGMNREKLQQALGIGGTIVKDIYIGLYGSPMEAIMGGPKRFMFAMDLERLSVFPRLALPSRAKALPADTKFYEVNEETGEMPTWISFAFIRNMVIAGDPEGVERMIHAVKGTPMTLTRKDMMTGEETSETINPKPLGASKVWQRLKLSLNTEGHFNFVLLLPNLLADPMIKESISESAEKFGLTRILGLVYSSQMDADGLKLKTEIIFDPPNPIFSLLKQESREMEWPGLLPDSYQVGVGFTVDNYPALWNTAKALMTEQTEEGQKELEKIFGTSDMESFLGLLGHEISVINFEGGTVYCLQVRDDAGDFFGNLEKENAEAAIAKAEKDIEAARDGGAEEFSAEAVERAVETLEDARNSKADGKLVEAVMLARKSSDFALDGLYSLFNLADKLTDSVSFNASEQNEAAKTEFYNAKDAYEAGNWAEGTKAARKAVLLGKAAYLVGKAGDAVDEARFAGADEKAAGLLATAESTVKAAKKAFGAGNLESAALHSRNAVTRALKAKAAATGKAMEDGYVQIPELKPIDFTLPDVQSPRAVKGTEVFMSVGVEPTSYAFIRNDVMCVGNGEEMDKYLENPRGKVTKTEDIRTIMEIMQRETQGLVLVNIRGMLDEQGTLSEEIADPDDEDERKRVDIAKTLSMEKLIIGLYLVSSEDSVALTTVSPTKLFDGSTASGARSAAAITMWTIKWLFYLFGVICLYLTFRMLAGKKEEE